MAMLIRGLPLDVLFRLSIETHRVDLRNDTHVFLCVADHYEPMVGGASLSDQRSRVERWIKQYPKMCQGIEDSWGRSPQHTFFYPAEEYRPEPIDQLASLCQAGYGDVEVHLHHDNDTAESLSETLLDFVSRLHNDHGLLRSDEAGQIRYGFIHGNWALDNSRPDGKWCGVNNELQVLIDTGCYADYTLPSAPSPTQTRIVNSIYYARGKPGKAKGHDQGRLAKVGVAPDDNSLLMIQGPLTVDWRRRKFGLIPRIDNAEIHGSFPPSSTRLWQWLKAAVRVTGRDNWYLVKLHTHGAVDRNADMLLGDSARTFHKELMKLRQQQPNFHYYYVTAWEMAQLVHQAEQGDILPRQPIQNAQSLSNCTLKDR